jgi:hypothetical protein
MSSRSDKQAKINEDQRNRAIHEGIGQVNAIYGSGREAQYGDYLQALRDRYTADLTDQSAIVDRKSKFSLARRGVIGGSAEQDTQRRNRKAYIQSLLANESGAQGAVGRLRQSDESSRQNLINMIFGGLDASTSAQRAGAAMRGNLAAAQSDFIPSALSSMAGAGANTYAQGAQYDAYRAGSRSAREALYG